MNSRRHSAAKSLPFCSICSTDHRNTWNTSCQQDSWTAFTPTAGSRAHAEFALARFQNARGEPGELNRELPGIARVDDLLDPERLGGAVRRSQLLQPFLDFGNRCLTVRRRV